jgi:hypothetical protein
MSLEIDDGVNDEEYLRAVSLAVCQKLEAEGFFEKVAKKYGLTLRFHVNFQASPGDPGNPVVPSLENSSNNNS